jgi:hypothetical protein
MTPEQMELVKTLGLSAVFLLQLKVVWDALQANHAETMNELKGIRGEQESIKSRITRLEFEFAINDPPTKPKRPQWLDSEGELKPGPS